VRDHDIQTVGCAALEDYDETLGARTGLGGAERGARQKAGDGGGADDGEAAVAKKYATSDGHKDSS
jgi:hypothetical protein